MDTVTTLPVANTTLVAAVTVADDDSPDAFVYILVVLSFYALAMTVLMVKYIRRENQEAQLSYYFTEFINRDKFHTPRYRNKEGVTAIKRTLSRLYHSIGLVEVDSSTPSALDTASQEAMGPRTPPPAHSEDSGLGCEGLSEEEESSEAVGPDVEDGRLEASDYTDSGVYTDSGLYGQPEVYGQSKAYRDPLVCRHSPEYGDLLEHREQRASQATVAGLCELPRDHVSTDVRLCINDHDVSHTPIEGPPGGSTTLHDPPGCGTILREDHTLQQLRLAESAV